MSRPRDAATAAPSTTTDKLREIETMAASALVAAEDLVEALDGLPDGWADLRRAARELEAAADTCSGAAGLALDRAEGRPR